MVPCKQRYPELHLSKSSTGRELSKAPNDTRSGPLEFYNSNKTSKGCLIANQENASPVAQQHRRTLPDDGKPACKPCSVARTDAYGDGRDVAQTASSPVQAVPAACPDSQQLHAGQYQANSNQGTQLQSVQDSLTDYISPTPEQLPPAVRPRSLQAQPQSNSANHGQGRALQDPKAGPHGTAQQQQQRKWQRLGPASPAGRLPAFMKRMLLHPRLQQLKQFCDQEPQHGVSDQHVGQLESATGKRAIEQVQSSMEGSLPRKRPAVASYPAPYAARLAAACNSSQVECRESGCITLNAASKGITPVAETPQPHAATVGAAQVVDPSAEVQMVRETPLTELLVPVQLCLEAQDSTAAVVAETPGPLLVTGEQGHKAAVLANTNNMVAATPLTDLLVYQLENQPAATAAAPVEGQPERGCSSSWGAPPPNRAPTGHKPNPAITQSAITAVAPAADTAAADLCSPPLSTSDSKKEAETAVIDTAGATAAMGLPHAKGPGHGNPSHAMREQWWQLEQQQLQQKATSGVLVYGQLPAEAAAVPGVTSAAAAAPGSEAIMISVLGQAAVSSAVEAEGACAATADIAAIQPAGIIAAKPVAASQLPPDEVMQLAQQAVDTGVADRAAAALGTYATTQSEAAATAGSTQAIMGQELIDSQTPTPPLQPELMLYSNTQNTAGQSSVKDASAAAAAGTAQDAPQPPTQEQQAGAAAATAVSWLDEVTQSDLIATAGTMLPATLNEPYVSQTPAANLELMGKEAVAAAAAEAETSLLQGCSRQRGAAVDAAAPALTAEENSAAATAAIGAGEDIPCGALQEAHFSGHLHNTADVGPGGSGLSPSLADATLGSSRSTAGQLSQASPKTEVAADAAAMLQFTLPPMQHSQPTAAGTPSGDVTGAATGQRHAAAMGVRPCSNVAPKTGAMRPVASSPRFDPDLGIDLEAAFQLADQFELEMNEAHVNAMVYCSHRKPSKHTPQQQGQQLPPPPPPQQQQQQVPLQQTRVLQPQQQAQRRHLGQEVLQQPQQQDLSRPQRQPQDQQQQDQQQQDQQQGSCDCAALADITHQQNHQCHPGAAAGAGSGNGGTAKPVTVRRVRWSDAAAPAAAGESPCTPDASLDAEPPGTLSGRGVTQVTVAKATPHVSQTQSELHLSPEVEDLPFHDPCQQCPLVCESFPFQKDAVAFAAWCNEAGPAAVAVLQQQCRIRNFNSYQDRLQFLQQYMQQHQHQEQQAAPAAGFVTAAQAAAAEADAAVAASERLLQGGAAESAAAGGSGNSGFKLLWVRVFTEEYAGRNGYTRRFLAASYQAVWRRHLSTPPNRRHLYEVIQAGHPCHLYFDVEYNKLANPTADGDQLVNQLLALVRDLLMRMEKPTDISLTKGCVVELDSSTPEKFSRHIVVRAPGCAFRDNIQVGAFVRTLTSISDDSHFLYLAKQPGCSERACMVDTAVYTKNRHFRMLGSSKGGKQALLQPTINRWAMSAARNNRKELQDHQLFLMSLICNVHPNSILLDFIPPIPAPLQQQLAQYRHQQQQKDGLSFGGPEVMYQYPEQPDGGPVVAGTEAPAGLARSYRSIKATWGALEQQLQEQQTTAAAQSESPSQMLLDAAALKHVVLQSVWFVEDVATRRAGGASAQVRTVAYCGRSSASSRHCAFAFSLIGPGSHMCGNVGRNHRNNHVFYVLDFAGGVWCQKCHDPDCWGFRSPWNPLPQDVWQKDRLMGPQ